MMVRRAMRAQTTFRATENQASFWSRAKTVRTLATKLRD